MTIEKLQVRDLRIIEYTELQPGKEINIITGENASGKSSLLEAIHLLLLSRSFRSTSTENIIRRNKDRLQIISQINISNNRQTLGLEKTVTTTTIRYAGKKIKSAAQLATIQPVVILTPETYQLVQGEPSKRRKLIDWLLFHVEQTYHENWQAYYKVLKQRNAVLKKSSTEKENTVWEEKLAKAATILDQQRQSSLEKLAQTLQIKISEYCDFQIKMEYDRGWKEENLLVALQKEREKDKRAGYTRKGPHRSDLLFTTDERPATQVLSRGQIKLLTTALELSKILLVEKETGKKTLILVDDLAAELDSERKEKITEMLISTETQQFITATEEKLLPESLKSKSKKFHVEQGRIQEVI